MRRGLGNLFRFLSSPLLLLSPSAHLADYKYNEHKFLIESTEACERKKKKRRRDILVCCETIKSFFVCYSRAEAVMSRRVTL